MMNGSWSNAQGQWNVTIALAWTVSFVLCAGGIQGQTSAENATSSEAVVAIRIENTLRIVGDSFGLSHQELLKSDGFEAILINSDLMSTDRFIILNTISGSLLITALDDSSSSDTLTIQRMPIVQFILGSEVDDMYMEVASTDGSFNDDQRTIAQKTIPGSLIYIERMRVVAPGGQVHTMPTKAIRILPQ